MQFLAGSAVIAAPAASWQVYVQALRVEGGRARLTAQQFSTWKQTHSLRGRETKEKKEKVILTTLDFLQVGKTKGWLSHIQSDGLKQETRETARF